MTDQMLHIGPVTLENYTVFAPLAGISDLPMRLLAREAGCALVCSEMISSNGLVYGSVKTRRMINSDPAEKPVSVQIFGADPGVMADAARIVESSGADILDINFGCAVKKILKTGAGAALMKSPGQAEAVMASVRKAVRLPVTIKLRSGWDSSGRDALAIARIAENCGMNAVSIHPRTASQGFKGKADWSVIASLKANLSLPVIGNGDIADAPDALRMKAETGCDAVMVGRAAIGNPWIFSHINAMVKGATPEAVDTATRFQTMIRFLEVSSGHYGETQACLMMRSRLGWFVKGLPHAGKFRESIKKISSKTEARMCIRDYQKLVKATLGPDGSPFAHEIPD